MKIKYYFFINLILLFGASFSDEIKFEADKTFFDTKKEVLELQGNVSLTYKNLLFEADKVKYDKKNNVFSSKKLSFSSLDNYLYGTTKELIVSDTAISLNQVEFSTCPCADKIWWIESEEISFNQEVNFLTAKKSKLIVQGTTLAYINKANFPTSTDRKSGILLPEVSLNERSGLDVKIPVYINLKENLDLTVEPRVMTKRGYGITNKLRYLGKNHKGFFNLSTLYDDESSYRILESKDLRWSYNLNHSQKINPKTFFNLDSASSGDPFYLSDLGSFASGLSRTYVLPQKANLDYFGKNILVRADISSFKLTNPLSSNQFQRFPGLQVKYFFNNENLNFDLNTDFALYRKGGSFRNGDKQTLTRVLLNPKISYAFLKKNYLLETIFSINYQHKNVEGIKDNDVLSTLNINQSLNFYKLSGNKKFFIKPFVNFTISDQKDIVNKNLVFSGLRINSSSESLRFGDVFLSDEKDMKIGFNLHLKEEKENNLNLNINKLYSFETKSILFENSRLILPEPLSLSLDYQFKKNILFKTFISIDKNEDFSSYSNSINFRENKYNISLNHHLIKNISIFSLKSSNQEKKKINSLEFSAKFNLSKKWSVGIKVIDDLEQEKSINSVISFDYENDGLIVGFSYINSRELDWVSILENSTFRDYHNDRFRLYFELKGLGSLGRPKEDYLKRRSL